jgi:selenide,water dikinase
MLSASGAAARLWADEVPYLDGARDLVGKGAVAGGTRRNLAFVEPWVTWREIEETDRFLLADAQTSGGLLIACAPDRLEALNRELLERGDAAAVVGVVADGRAGTIAVTPSKT